MPDYEVVAAILANGYRIAAPRRQVYLQCARAEDAGEYVTEIQFPVEKA